MTTGLTVTIPPDLAAAIERAVDTGPHKTPEAVVEHALRAWQARREEHAAKLAALKADIEVGLADIAAGRVVDFDPEDIIARGWNGQPSA